jgi:Holliday junction resolvasome RuvABC endonuclease subunit
MSHINVLAVDPSLANFGMAYLRVELSSLEISITGLSLIETEKRSNKTVRQNSDDLRRAQEIVQRFHAAAAGNTVCFAEIPTGAQSARAMYAFGLSVGVLASCPIPLIQVQPFETKLATVGTKTASKEEMIEWAVEKYSTAPWLRHGGKIVNKNEHLADAVAIAHAGVKHEQFQQLLAMWRATGTIANQKESVLSRLVSQH